MIRLRIVASIISVFLFVTFSPLVTGGGTALAIWDDCSGKSPLPGYKIETPTSDVPEEITRFLGTWIGHWKHNGNDALCHTLIVESVSSDGTVQVIYSTGVYRTWNIDRGSYNRFEGIIEYGELTFILTNGYIVTYRLNNNELSGNYNRGRSFGWFQKQ